LDTDRSGSITAEEIGAALKIAGKDVGDIEDLRELLISHDGSAGVGTLTFDDFVRIMEQNRARSYRSLQFDSSDDETSSEDEDDDELMDTFSMLTADEISLFTSLFKQVDVAHKGVIDPESLHIAIRNLSLRESKISESEMSFYFGLLEEVEKSSTREINLDDFLIVAQQHPAFLCEFQARDRFNRRQLTSASFSFQDEPIDDRYRAVFAKFDKDGDGCIVSSEVTGAMQELGNEASPEHSQFFFHLLELIGDEGITYEDFFHLMQESSESIAELGRSVATWASRQSKTDIFRTKSLIQQSMRQVGFVSSVLQEEQRIQEQEVEKLTSVNRAISRFFAARSVTALPSDLLTPVELRKYQAVFNSLDRDSDGYISQGEFTENIRNVIGRQPTKQQIDEFLQLADTDMSGGLDFEEFVAVIQKTKRELQSRQKTRNSKLESIDTESTVDAARRMLQRYKALFDRFDLNKDGKISSDELKNVLKSLNKCPTDHGVKKLIDSVDKNGDGVLDFEEFVNLMQAQAAQVITASKK
jgi:calmodulin